MDFIEWLKAEMEKRDWSQNELARRAGVTSGHMSLVMTGMREPGPELCRGLARALGIPETVVFVEAGLMSSPRNSTEITLLELYELMEELPIEDQRAILREARERYHAVHGSEAGPEPATT